MWSVVPAVFSINIGSVSFGAQAFGLELDNTSHVHQRLELVISSPLQSGSRLRISERSSGLKRGEGLGIPQALQHFGVEHHIHGLVQTRRDPS
jgi:hypothetical protein